MTTRQRYVAVGGVLLLFPLLGSIGTVEILVWLVLLAVWLWLLLVWARPRETGRTS